MSQVKAYTGTVTVKTKKVRANCCTANSTIESTRGVISVGGSVEVPDKRKRSTYLALLRHNLCATTSLEADEETFEWEEDFIELGVNVVCSGTPKYCTQTYTGNQFYMTYSGTASDRPSNPSLVDVSGANTLALEEYNRSYLSARESLQGLVAAGEVPETLRMIKSRSRSMSDALSRYLNRAEKLARSRSLGGRRRKRRGYKIKDFENDLADDWLEMAFGWKPLISDLDNGAEALAKAFTQSVDWVKPIDGRGELMVQNSNQLKTQSDPNRKWRIKKRIRPQVQYVGKVKLSPSAYTQMMRFGLTPDRFIPTVWELCPWSFLIDYFTNVGAVIDGWSTCYTGLLWTQRTNRRLSQTVVENQELTTNTGWTFSSISPGSLLWERKLVSRYRYYGSLIPDFRWQIPGVGSTKWINMSALARRSRSISKLASGLLK